MSDRATKPAPFVLVTGNRNKLKEAERLLGYSPEHADIDLPEIQSLDLEEVLRFKVEEAHRHLRRPVVVEETGLCLDALGGFPGPLVKWMLDAVGAVGIARCGIAMGDAGVQAVCKLAYFDGDRLLTAGGETRGTLVENPRGQHGFGWDPVFQPEGFELTFAEMSPADKDVQGHRGRAWRAFRRCLEASGVLVPD